MLPGGTGDDRLRIEPKRHTPKHVHHVAMSPQDFVDEIKRIRRNDRSGHYEQGEADMILTEMMFDLLCQLGYHEAVRIIGGA